MGRRTQQLAVLVILALASTLLAPGAAHAVPTWLPETTLSGLGPDLNNPQVVLDGAGNANAVWEHSEGGITRIQSASRPAGGSWTAPIAISEGGRSAFSPQVVVDADDTATAVWYRSDGAKLRIETSTRPSGGTWTTPSILSESGQSAIAPQIALDPAGNATAVWYRYDGATNRIQASSRLAGGGWSSPVTISVAGQNAYDPQVAIDPDGHATAVWYRYDGAHHVVQASTRPSGGNWTTPTSLSGAGQNARGPQVVVDPAGTATAVWHRTDGTNYRVQASTRPANGDWSIPTTLSEADQWAEEPQVAVSPTGDLTAVWHRYDGASYRVQASTRPRGGAWSTIPATLSEAGQSATAAQVVVDDGGRATAVWQRIDGTNYRAQASTRSPGEAWPTATTLSPPGVSAASPKVAVQPAGNAVVLWSGYSGGQYRVQSVGLDAVGPVVSALEVPATGTSGTPVGMSVAASDVWSAVEQPIWSFGDGATATGTTVSHTWTNPGNYTVSVTLTDAVGNTTQRTATINITAAPLIPLQVTPPAAAAPEITGLRLKPKKIEINGPRRKTRTQVILRLTEDAKVTITLKRKGANGKKAKQKVVLRKSLDSGRTKLRLTSKQLERKLGKRHFKPGRYKLTVKATNTAGRDKRSTTLRIVR